MKLVLGRAGIWGKAAGAARFLPALLLLLAGLSAGRAQGGAATSTNAPTPRDFGAQSMAYIGQHLSTYEPIYFILGTYPAAEFQFSLKYRVFNLNGPLNPLGHLYFGYTQTSYWDLLTSDPSFYDTSYKPSVFLYYTNVLHDAGDSLFRLDLQPGVEHESNGQGGGAERSIYTAYLQPTARFDPSENWEFRLQPRAWAYFLVGGNNENIAEYRGYVELQSDVTWSDKLAVPWADTNAFERVQLAAKVRMGDEWSHTGLWFDLRFNLAFVPYLSKLNPSIQVEYFTGYGQTLRQYDQSSHGLRAGLCLWF